MSIEPTVRVLVVTDHPDVGTDLIAAIRARAERSPARFRVVVPNPAAAELHLLHPERHERAAEAEHVLHETLPVIELLLGSRVFGSVSVRHDPMDAVEEVLFSEPVDEIIVALRPHGLTRWLHQDLAHRLQHFHLPVTVVEERIPANKR